MALCGSYIFKIVIQFAISNPEDASYCPWKYGTVYLSTTLHHTAWVVDGQNTHCKQSIVWEIWSFTLKILFVWKKQETDTIATSSNKFRLFLWRKCSEWWVGRDWLCALSTSGWSQHVIDREIPKLSSH